MPQRDSLIYKKVPTGISYIFLMLMGAVALLLFYLYIDFTEEFEDLYGFVAPNHFNTPSPSRSLGSGVFPGIIH